MTLSNKYIPAISSFAFPVSSAVLPEWSKDLEGEWYNGTEHDFPGGFYPLGENSLWHGGIHLKVPVGSAVLAPCEGTIVAARLAEHDSGYYGSANFILMKHTITGYDLILTQPNIGNADWIEKTRLYEFFSLYMHLSPELLEISNGNLETVEWIKTLSEPIDLIGSVGKNGVNYPDDVMLVQNLLKRCGCYTYQVDKLCGPKTEKGLQKFIADPDSPMEPGDAAWQKLVSAFMATNELRQNIVDQLKSGEIVPLNINVATGDVLWTSGEYIDESQPEGIIHWEIFSEENIFPQWTTIEDSQEGYNIDCSSFLAQSGISEDSFTSGEPLEREQVLNFYKSNPDAEKVRKYVCRFHNEWAVNPDTALEKIKNVYDITDLADLIRPYLWWEISQQKEVPLPASPLVYHYNPISFLSALESAFRFSDEGENDYSDTDFVEEMAGRTPTGTVNEE